MIGMATKEDIRKRHLIEGSQTLNNSYHFLPQVVNFFTSTVVNFLVDKDTFSRFSNWMLFRFISLST